MLEGLRVARALEAATGIPLRFCSMLKELVGAFGASQGTVDKLPILAMERHIVAPFARKPRGSRRRSTVV